MCANGWRSLRRNRRSLATSSAKESWCDRLPFRHLRVKVKREIIRMNQPQRAAPAPAARRRSMPPRWRAGSTAATTTRAAKCVLLDTRNAFEVDARRVRRRDRLALERSSANFPAALAAHRAELEGKTVVSYCTGGIRCEKAALAMRDAGLEHVYQLDGGVLRYFERLPDAPHWRGRCFVFDSRETLGPDLAPPPRPIRPGLVGQ